MKKIISIFIILAIAITSSISCLSTTSSAEYIETYNLEPKKWTLMFYGDGDWPGGWPLTDFLTQVGISSSNNVDIVALDDVPDGPAKLWYIDNNSSRILLEEKGEINMGDYETLRDFINYCKTNYSAERYALNLWDHGAAWKGACMDITNVSGGYDILTMDEMQMALEESGGVNIIGFSACVMGCIESAYELRNCTEVYIGSEEMHGIGIEWVQVADILEEYPNESTYNISYKIMELFKTNYPYVGRLYDWTTSMIMQMKMLILPYPPALTISAVRTDKIEMLVSSVNNLSNTLIDNINLYKRTITRVRFRVDDYPRPMIIFSPMGDTIDIYHFVDLIDKPRFRLLTPELHEAVEDVKECLEMTLIDEYHQVGHRNAHGLSIYFPPKYTPIKLRKYDSSYPNCGLDFTEDTRWDEFLELYLS